MNSDQQPLWKRIGIGILLAGGLFAMVRLVYISVFSRNALPAETSEQRRANVIRSMEIEKEASRKAWIESGKPLPPGGFDVIWNRANGITSPAVDPNETSAQ